MNTIYSHKCIKVKIIKNINKDIEEHLQLIKDLKDKYKKFKDINRIHNNFTSI